MTFYSLYQPSIPCAASRQPQGRSFRGRATLGHEFNFHPSSGKEPGSWGGEGLNPREKACGASQQLSLEAKIMSSEQEPSQR